MSILKSEHSPGIIRIVVGAGKAKEQAQYYIPIGDDEEQTLKVAQQIEKAARIHAERRLIAKAYGTGVRSISINCQFRGRKKKTTSGMLLTVSVINNKQRKTYNPDYPQTISFYIHLVGYEAAWNAACNKLAEIQGLAEPPKEWLEKRPGLDYLRNKIKQFNQKHGTTFTLPPEAW